MPKLYPVHGYPGYFASANGRIWSTKRSTKPKPLKASWNGHYYNITLFVGTEPKTVHVHVAMCLAFYGPPKPGQEARHLNGNSHDSRRRNLCWGTKLENNHDRIRHGTIPRGKAVHTCQLNDWEVMEIRAYLAAGVREKILAIAYGVSQSTIKHIKHRRSWAYLPQLLAA